MTVVNFLLVQLNELSRLIFPKNIWKNVRTRSEMLYL